MWRWRWVGEMADWMSCCFFQRSSFNVSLVGVCRDGFPDAIGLPHCQSGSGEVWQYGRVALTDPWPAPLHPDVPAWLLRPPCAPQPLSLSHTEWHWCRRFTAATRRPTFVPLDLLGNSTPTQLVPTILSTSPIRSSASNPYTTKSKWFSSAINRGIIRVNM